MRRVRIAAALGAAVIAAVGGAVLVDAGPAGAATAGYKVVDNWGSGYQGSFTVTNNTSSRIASWQVEFDLPAGSKARQAWNARLAGPGPHVRFSNESWNGALGAGASTSFGFIIDGRGTPSHCLVNGAPCAGSGSPTASPGPTAPPAPPTSAPTSRPATPPTTRPTTPPTTPPSSPRPSPTGTPPAAGTPVAQHGQLHVCGTTMCDKNNAKVQLRGISSMWLNWESKPYAENLAALTWMRDNWHLQVIRAAMGVEPSGAYLSDPAKARTQVETVIRNAQTAGVYVIVDFHADTANNERAQAVAFFSDLAKRYGNLPNVIWEDWNEPHQVSWTGVLKPYHQAVVSAIRAVDPDNIIVLGTPTWSQDVDTAAASPVSGTNLMYTLHFYSCSHGASLRSKGDAAMRAGLALFITEWGAANADGGLDGKLCTAEAQNWLSWAKTNNISWAAWKLDVGNDSTNLLSPGAPVTGGWNGYLHGQASFVVANMK